MYSLGDAALVDEVIAGSRSAARQFIARNDAFLRAVILSSSPASRGVLDDLTHDVYVLIWRDDFRVLRQWRREHPLHAYLRPVVRRQVWERLGRLLPVGEQLEGDVAILAEMVQERGEVPATPEDEVAANQHVHLVRNGLSALKDSERRILELHFLAGLSYREIGGELGIKPGTAGARISRALHRLRPRCTNEMAAAGR